MEATSSSASSADDWLRLNRAWWDERAPVHAASGYYDVPGFLAGQDSLRAFEPGEVADVRGKRLLHLMCHIGLDTLSWARRGAIVTGLDFSRPALDTAVSVAGRAGIGSARFVAAEIGEASQALAGETFDVVYTGTGVTQWIPDIGAWARTVAVEPPHRQRRQRAGRRRTAHRVPARIRLHRRPVPWPRTRQ